MKNASFFFKNCFEKIDCFQFRQSLLSPYVFVVVALPIADCYAGKEFWCIQKRLGNSFLHLMHRKNSSLSSRFALTFELLIAAALSSDQIRISALLHLPLFAKCLFWLHYLWTLRTHTHTHTHELNILNKLHFFLSFYSFLCLVLSCLLGPLYSSPYDWLLQVIIIE